MGSNQAFSRLLKLTHAQTILYELDMLQLAKERLLFLAFASEGDKLIDLKACQLHYRNLLGLSAEKSGNNICDLVAERVHYNPSGVQ